CLQSLALAQDKVKISGAAFGDYFYNIENSSIAKKDLNGFQFRRIFFTTDFAVADNFDSRFRLEADQSSNSLTTGGKLGVMVKDAYLKWKGIFDGSDLVMGISPTPAFDASEAAWGYRTLEKTILDLDGIVSSRDFGIDLKGKLTGSGSVNYWVKIANNSGNAPETDKYKRIYGLLKFKLSENLQATVYADFTFKADKLDAFDNQGKSNNQVVGSAFLGYKQNEDFSIGVEAFATTIQNNFTKSAAEALQNQTGIGFSVWGWGALSETIKLVGRFDNYDPNSNYDADGTSFFMAGVDYKAAKNVSVIPNVQFFNYQAKDASGKTKKDLTARVTLAYTF
ncbi:MAG: hypothetical protein K8H86_04165, partial [Ignavibacteriaceae bacterium]|nr:hypothetical protein [Ignavibacteriaceae bacterium]